MRLFILEYWPLLGGVLALTVASAILVLRKRGSGQKGLGLEELVTLDSKGWLIMAMVAVFGAVVMIGSSAGIGVAYWTGLAINADVTAKAIDPAAAKGFFGFMEYATVGVVAYMFLAIIFELFSDLGTPLASGMKQRKKGLIPELVFIATVGCIGMSIVTKWGYYDDKRDVRRVETAQTVVEDSRWATQRDEAQAVIDGLGVVPSLDVANAKEVAANSTIAALERQIEAAEEARDLLPVTHSTNRRRAQEGIDKLSTDLSAAHASIIEVAQIKSDLAALQAATGKREEAVDHIKETAGKTLEGGQERTRAGDLFFVRIMRVGLHQFLCWLFPLVAFESFAAFGDTLKKEEANRKRRMTNAEKASTVDAAYEDLPPLAIDAKPYYDERTEEEEAELDAIRQERDDGTYDDGEGPVDIEDEDHDDEVIT